MKGFLSDIYLRPSCYACKCKKGASHSDLTIADFWGIHIVAPGFDDDKGVGLVLINSPKGNEHFSRLDMDTLPSTLQVAGKYNGGINEHTDAHPKRADFFSLIEYGQTVEQAVDFCLHIPLHKRAILFVKRAVRKLLKIAFGDAGVQAVKNVLRGVRK